MTIKRAKVLTDKQFSKLMKHLAEGLNPERDHVMFALSFKCGLRAQEIAGLNWIDVTDAEGNIYKPDTMIELPHSITKGSVTEGKIIMHKLVYNTLKNLRKANLSEFLMPAPRSPSGRMSTNNVTVYMHAVFKKLGYVGCSSHSGRRTFGTKLARIANKQGGSFVDVKDLLRHKDIRTTRAYVDSSDTQKKMIAAI